MAPMSDGKVIRLKVPDLTEERRKDLVKQIKKIVEERDTNADEKKIGECCGGIYAVGTENLLRYLEVVMRQRIHAEYYLTDIVPAAIEAGHRAVSVLAKDPTECMGINTPEQLHEAEKILTRRF
jgi:bifunctional N-acetylglucosamine-1-phosphate-uridyltransferase/glucosamine-1-phosphate-acetyltransferase GlmU-like protein